ncbi:MAG: hypothetical protein D3923_13435, partial [Candidatus Electrothrix sp. AR3]|nr:hypothetical protein [Candidatus Electrothrix sp. AR3]
FIPIKLGINTALGSAQASWNSGVNQAMAVYIKRSKDCWVQHVKSFAKNGETYHIRSHGIYIKESFRLTITDCHFEWSEHLGPGGNGYFFQISKSNEVLIKDSIGRHGRHALSINWDFGAVGNVFLRTESSAGRICNTLQDQKNDTCDKGNSDLHHALAIANLFDSNIINDGMEIGNRKEWSSGAGHTGTQTVLWNTQGTGTVYSYNFGMGYVIGTAAGMMVYIDPTLTNWLLNRYTTGSVPEDFSEHLGAGNQLEPSSLFEDQLAKRLGSDNLQTQEVQMQ